MIAVIVVKFDNVIILSDDVSRRYRQNGKHVFF